jgi:hypothetical protein
MGRAAAQPRSPSAKAEELAIFFGCHGFVCAIGTPLVERLVLADEVALAPAPLDSCAACAGYDHRSARLAGLAEIERQMVVVWDLGALLELGPLSSSIILLRVSRDGVRVPIALRAGPCMVVKPLAAVTSLPSDLLRVRQASMSGAFAAEVLGEHGAGALLGLTLDPAALFTRAELDLSAALLGHRKRVHGVP